MDYSFEVLRRANSFTNWFFTDKYLYKREYEIVAGQLLKRKWEKVDCSVVLHMSTNGMHTHPARLAGVADAVRDYCKAVGFNITGNRDDAFAIL